MKPDSETDCQESRAARLEQLRGEIAIALEQVQQGEVAPLDIDAIKQRGRKRLLGDDGGAKV